MIPLSVKFIAWMGGYSKALREQVYQHDFDIEQHFYNNDMEALHDEILKVCLAREYPPMKTEQLLCAQQAQYYCFVHSVVLGQIRSLGLQTPMNKTIYRELELRSKAVYDGILKNGFDPTLARELWSGTGSSPVDETV
ncbi:MAG: hypothetical protein CMJ32_09685 [Phycisphaerae bacterium]|nr:hypothetical protein [Phycisphaerae bacterium]